MIREQRPRLIYGYLSSFEDDVPETDGLSMRMLLNALQSQTSAHGVPNMYRARGTVKKCFWTLIGILMLAGLSYNVYGLTRKYFAYPKNVVISIVPAQNLTFPSVSICNLSPVNKSALTATNHQNMNPASVNISANAGKSRRKKRAIASMTPHYIGCYTDNYPTSRDLSVATFSSSTSCTVSSCQSFCMSVSSTYFGLQYNEECYCGNSYGSFGKVSETMCSSPCTGNQNQICGGNNFNSVYTVCSVGFYAANCNKTCHCANNASCFFANGSCPSGCSPGWTGPTCNVPVTTTIKTTSAKQTTTTKTTTTPTTTHQKTTQISTTVTTTKTTTIITTTTLQGTTSTQPKTTATTLLGPATSPLPTTTVTTPFGISTSLLSTTEVTTSLGATTSPLQTTTVTTPFGISTYPLQTTTVTTPLGIFTSPLQTTTVTTSLGATTTLPQTTTSTASSDAASTSVLTTTLTPSTQLQTTTIQTTSDALTTQSSSPALRTTTEQLQTTTWTTSSEAPTTTSPETTTPPETSTPLITTPSPVTTTHTTDLQETTNTFLLTTLPDTTLLFETSAMPSDSTTSTELTTTTIESTRLIPTSSPIHDGTTTGHFQPSILCCCSCCAISSSNVCHSCLNESLNSASVCASRLPSAEGTTSQGPTTRRDTTTAIPREIPKQRSIYTEAFEIQEKLTEALANFNVETKSRISFQFNDTIMDCTFDGQACNRQRDFIEYYNPFYGKCFLFNSGWRGTDSNLYISTSSGPRNGLVLIANVNQDDYSNQVGDLAGIRVVISDQNQLAFPEDEGITVSPGYETFLEMEQMTFERLPLPFSDCNMNVNNDSQRSVFCEMYPIQYRQSGCEKTCYQRHVIQQCGCADSHFPSYGVAFRYVSVPVCSIFNSNQDECVRNISRKFANNELDCDCPSRCQDTYFNVKSTSLSWPSKVREKMWLQSLISKLGSKFNISDDVHVRDNLVKVHVFYKSFDYESVVESATYPLVNFLSDLCGVIGLFFGFALMTFLEFVEFFADGCVLQVSKLLSSKSASTRKSSTHESTQSQAS